MTTMSSTDFENFTNSESLHQGNFYANPASVDPQTKDFVNCCNEPSSKEINLSAGYFRRTLDATKIEILAFLLLFSFTLIQITTTSMILKKVCLVHYNYSGEICNHLDNHTEIKSLVEKMANNYQLGHSLLLVAPSALLSCFVGPWSDRYGRKLPMLIALFGVLTYTLGSSACAYFLHSRVEYLYIPALFSGCSGSYITIFAAIYSYASDITPGGRRTRKYALLEMAVAFGQPLGTAAGGWVLKFLGYPSVFLISAGGFVTCFAWIAFLLPETRGRDNKDTSKFKKLFTCKAFKESVEATTKKRPYKGRKQILLLILSMCLTFTAVYCSGNINYLFVHHQYNWGDTKYSTITAIYSIIGVVVLGAVIPISKYFKLGDPVLGLIGTTSMILKYICFGLAWNPILFHIGSILGCMTGCAVMAERSRISKLVSKDELGKVFSLMASAETLVPVLMVVLFSEIFNAFLDTYAAMPYVILAFCLLLPFAVFIWMARLSTKDSTYKYFENEEVDA